MTRLTLFVVAGLLAVAMTSISAGAAQGPPTTTLQFLDITASNGSTIPNNQAPKLGDTFSFRDIVYKWSGGKRGARVGHVDGTFTFISDSAASIEALAHLPGGTLVILGPSSNGPVTKLAVVGGTGSYAAARGDVTVRNLGGPNSNKSAITIRLWQ
jgi:hypothetical protein